MIYEREHPVCGMLKGIGVPIKFSQTPARPSGPAPSLGRDTAAILEEIGYSPNDIEALKKEGFILTVDI